MIPTRDEPEDLLWRVSLLGYACNTCMNRILLAVDVKPSPAPISPLHGQVKAMGRRTFQPVSSNPSKPFPPTTCLSALEMVAQRIFIVTPFGGLALWDNILAEGAQSCDALHCRAWFCHRQQLNWNYRVRRGTSNILTKVYLVHLTSCTALHL